MAFPNFENKHLEEAIIHPADFVRYKNLHNKRFPEDYILIYDKKLLSRIKRKYPLKKLNMGLVHIDAYKYHNIGLVKITGIGSPHAVTVFEELIALGGRRFLSLGTAGGLQREGIFLCERAIRDEGTSSHYQAHEKYSFPDKKLTNILGESLAQLGLDFERSTSWTIDAPYRETSAELFHYKKEGVATVEMEASALFAVAKYRKVKIASAFVVSDVLGEKWEPKFHHMNTKQGLNKLVEAGFNCFKK
jgi:uridine phosphorylase